MNDLEYQLSEVREKVNYQETLIADLQENGREGSLADYSFDVYPFDWENGTVTFKFTITPNNISDNTRVVIDNTLETVELERSGNSFVGTVDYPIDEYNYETSYQVYNGDVTEGSEIMERIGAHMMAGKVAYAEFNGFMSYGNHKLTLAGDLGYTLNIDEELESAKIVFKDNVIDLGISKEGMAEVNFSEAITLDAENNFSEVYIEFVTESGVTYQVYPGLYIDATYSVGENSDNVFVRQEDALVAIMKDGTVYEIGNIY